jgi:hypothetical protein
MHMARTEADIRTRAFELWLGRAKGHGHDKEDWYTAEAVLDVEEALGRKLYPPEFRVVGPAEILGELQVSHAGINGFFSPGHLWIETAVAVETIFGFDRNRRLHFDEGFLNASYRVATDLSVTAIGEESHFPYRDLSNVRAKIRQLAELYRSGVRLPPPLFFYPAPFQLEVLDGVHRSLAAFEALRNSGSAGFLIWLGFNHQAFTPGLVIQQLWSDAIGRLRHARHQNHQDARFPLQP